MAWTVKFSEEARKDLKRLDPEVARRIVRFLRERIAINEDPRRVGETLEGLRLGELWIYRPGNWRMTCRTDNEKILVWVLKIGHRRSVYKGRVSEEAADRHTRLDIIGLFPAEN